MKNSWVSSDFSPSGPEGEAAVKKLTVRPHPGQIALAETQSRVESSVKELSEKITFPKQKGQVVETELADKYLLRTVVFALIDDAGNLSICNSPYYNPYSYLLCIHAK
ncbi:MULTISPECIES: hypothetical protein [Pseudomonas syringae group genomosp. 2]|uniref:hypothetical protein n=1 Tax=Pseudomonas syringae group genomosp. 2 TaxID=251698 RepID=UPI00117CB6C0|nr:MULTISPECIES: hypothetical protein [Pseudomonas syringae group genomosp. 2]MCQ3013875.1 hypothetical protein [Pseudomonas savastanoi]UNO25297.1 hypothetical protein MDO45_23650 [Pseudomonas amygdali pv. aesculi]WGQ00196.1 hypothetical protein QFG70_23875 [Pseudomonas amygdali pv. aesculi]